MIDILSTLHALRYLILPNTLQVLIVLVPIFIFQLLLQQTLVELESESGWLQY